MSEDERRMVRDTFERAAQGDSSIERLLQAVPALQARARREPADERSKLIPRLAIATAAMTILALLSAYTARSAARDPATTLDSLILSGVENGEHDALLDAVLATERNDG